MDKIYTITITEKELQTFERFLESTKQFGIDWSNCREFIRRVRECQK